MSTVTQYTMLT